MFIAVVWWLASEAYDLGKSNSHTLVNYNQRLNELEISSNTGMLADQYDKFRYDTRVEMKEMEAKSVARIYSVKITICKKDDTKNEITKRYIQMDNLLAINPSVERTATTIDTWLDYHSNVEIPDKELQSNEDSYACDLKVLSVR